MGQPDTLTLDSVARNKMSERILSAINDVEKGGRPVFPLMPFHVFPEYMALLRKALKKKAQKRTDK
ncbi:hypothetical protein [Escherichia coli]|uniref:hypothetical protein n=1 Tax=Escherichia coli TaxID=562 RepID=UPI00098CCDAC|nr:hypothetical protein [Escherichia coli]MBF9528254.1 hypothetical protein [Escherichia coli]TYD67424.1 hypothetical protein DJ504_26030 [Escherichia coli]HDQ0055589.1 hypothetical protein [Escherichia coli]